MVALMDAQRDDHALPAWQPALWEGSSALVSLLLLPGLLALCSRWPMHADTWRRRLPLYVGASVAWSVVHVVGMVLVRKAGYLLVGDHYEIEDWLRRFAYEYLKDARTFALIVRSEEHTSELQSLMRISYAVFCLKKTKQHIKTQALLRHEDLYK